MGVQISQHLLNMTLEYITALAAGTPHADYAASFVDHVREQVARDTEESKKPLMHLMLTGIYTNMPTNKINAIKLLRSIADIGLKEAKEQIEDMIYNGRTSVIASGRSLGAFQEFVNQFEELGFIVEIKPVVQPE